MARTRTLTNLILDVRQRTNQENSTFVTDAELTEYLNQELAELWGRLVLNQGQPYFRSSAVTAVTAGTALYALPADFWSLQEVTATVGGVVGRVLPFEPSEHAALSNGGTIGLYGPVRYRLQGSNIEFRPAIESFSATLYYTPCQTRLAAGSDTFDGYNGAEVAAIYGVCATVLAKEESDPSFYVGMKERMLAQIDKWSAHRDMANPGRVQDVSLESELGLDGWLL